MMLCILNIFLGHLHPSYMLKKCEVKADWALGRDPRESSSINRYNRKRLIVDKTLYPQWNLVNNRWIMDPIAPEKITTRVGYSGQWTKINNKWHRASDVQKKIDQANSLGRSFFQHASSWSACRRLCLSYPDAIGFEYCKYMYIFIMHDQEFKIKFRLRHLDTCLFSAAASAVSFKGQIVALHTTNTGNKFSQLKI